MMLGLFTALRCGSQSGTKRENVVPLLTSSFDCRIVGKLGASVHLDV